MLQAVADVEWSKSGLVSLGIQPSAFVSYRGKVRPFEYFWNSRKSLVDEFIRGSSQYKLAREQGQGDEEALERLRADKEFMQALREEKTRLQAGFLALEPNTGHVKAWVGSRDYNEDKFDHVQQARRQPGSTFKPFVYGAAFEQGIPPNETLMDAPVEIRIDRNKVWRPGDVGEGPSNQPMTLREGLSRSKNTITAQLMMRVGPSRVASLARSMGVRESRLDEVPSLALGTSPVTLKEMVASFGTIANGGNYIEPVVVTAVEDRQGNVLESFGGQASEPALSSQAAMTLLDVMRGVVEEGTAVGLKHRFGINGDVAGKTGTTQDNTDGWFILMHPQLVAGAWVGFNDNRVTMRSEYWGQGSHNALLVVGDFYKTAFARKALDPKATFAAPRMKDQEQPLMDRMNDWFNSVFNSAPPVEPEPEVVATPEYRYEPPQLEPPPLPPVASIPAPLPEPRPLPPVMSDAPVVLEPQRVPDFPRPLEAARPAETVPGTQVWRAPEVARAPERQAESTRSVAGGGTNSTTTGSTTGSSRSGETTVLVPRPWQPPEPAGRSTASPGTGSSGTSTGGSSTSASSAAGSSTASMGAASGRASSSPVADDTSTTTSSPAAASSPPAVSAATGSASAGSSGSTGSDAFAGSSGASDSSAPVSAATGSATASE